MLFLYIYWEYSAWVCFVCSWFYCYVVAFVDLFPSCRRVIAFAWGLTFMMWCNTLPVGFVCCYSGSSCWFAYLQPCFLCCSVAGISICLWPLSLLLCYWCWLFLFVSVCCCSGSGCWFAFLLACFPLLQSCQYQLLLVALVYGPCFFQLLLAQVIVGWCTFWIWLFASSGGASVGACLLL